MLACSGVLRFCDPVTTDQRALGNTAVGGSGFQYLDRIIFEVKVDVDSVEYISE
jgi:hypothetical protein